ncbi:hypothetical protein [Actinoplanes sp. N902-109]|uniref:hypothetical protein n=1 Tax=Actinoplanes sp. (strain N902-109) TaxID=649831 RepID=UPI00059F7C9E|nr:hypothetical protein [Actinoplanes sp. N902-109]
MQKDNRAEDAAREATDRLALALEDAGFDVGQEFPDLHHALVRQGSGVVRLGDVTPAVANRLTGVLCSGLLETEGDTDS